MIPCQKIEISRGGGYPMRRLKQLIRRVMWDDDRETQLASTIRIREIVTEHPLLGEIIHDPDVVSRFVQFLAYDDFPYLKHAAASVLVDSGTVPLIVQLINADSEEDRSVAVGALRNIALGSIECRDHILSCGALMTLLSQCDVPNQTITMLKAAMDTLIILCSVMPCPPLAQIQPALPVLNRFLHSENSDLLLLSSALLGLFFERGGDDETRQTLMDLGVFPRLMELFEHEDAEIHKEVIRTISAVLRCENRDHSQVVIDHIPIPSIASYLTKAEYTNAKTTASFIVYKVASWGQNQLEEVIASGVVQNMIPLLQDHDPDLVGWCLETISRVTRGRNHEHISLLVRQGCIKALCDTLTSPEQSIIPMALNALEDILGVGRDEENLVKTGSRYARMILDVGGLEKINALKASQDEYISHKAMNIVADYFNEDKKWW